MILADYYFADPRVVLVPIEHLTPDGVSDAFAAAAAVRAGWTTGQVALLNEAIGLYWTRTAELARRTSSWAPPRLRHIAVLREPLAIHPYAQLLNTSAWTLYASDLDPVRSHAELVAYLLAHGDRTARLGEVTMAALHNAAWWFARSDAECQAFAAAAVSSARPDAAAFQALAEALPWLRRLRHARLRPAPAGGHRAIPGTELLVPPADLPAPQRLLDRWTGIARGVADRYTAAWRDPDAAAVDALADWLATTTPPLLITHRDGPLLWERASPSDLQALRAELGRASGAAVRDVHGDLAVLDRHTRRFLASLADPGALSTTAPDAEQRGYAYMHRERRLLAYNLDEPGIDRRHGPALPYARAMLGARAMHEWTHLAVEAGWVPLALPAAELERRVGALAAELDAVIAAAPEKVRRATAEDLGVLLVGTAATAGAALARLLLLRMSDFQANLLAARYLDETERETYVRQNVRTLRAEYPAARLWRMLLRYLYELQYLRFSAVADRRTFFLRSTWFDADFIDTGVLDEATFDALASAVAAICDCYAVDEARFSRIPDVRG
jgi:hypothetical protein